MANEIRFWSGMGEHACLSNLRPVSIRLDGKVWRSVEHFYQAQKTTDPGERERIRKAVLPGEAKRRGRQASLRAGWCGMRDAVMIRALRAKFFQHPDLGTVLLGTGHARLVEDSPSDSYWGGKLPGSTNRLGQLLMQVRYELSIALYVLDEIARAFRVNGLPVAISAPWAVCPWPVGGVREDGR